MGAAAVAAEAARRSLRNRTGPAASRSRAFLLLAFAAVDMMTCRTDPEAE